MRKRAPKKAQSTTGIVKRNPDGFGFLLPDDPNEEDVYLPRHTMQGIMTDDHVEVHRTEERPGRFSGEIVKVLKRSVTQVVGLYREDLDRDGGMLLDQGFGWGQNLLIPSKDSMNAREGQLVAVRIIDYPGTPEGFNGVVIEVLGDFGDPLLDTKHSLYSNHVPVDFSSKTLNEIQIIPDTVPEEDTKDRLNLRNKPFVTIDGKTARDFDDAVFAEKTNDGFCVWVAIADVAHYVKTGTSLDDDAYQRGTSVYFPDMVVPMLPEKLSNGVCSLNPKVDRLVMVAQINISHAGEILNYKFHEGVIKSWARLTYGEVQEILDGNEHSLDKEIDSSLSLMADVAKILMGRRFKNGSLDLELPETQIILDDKGVPVDISRSERLFAHRLIEELMLLANISVALFVQEKKWPCLFRIHEEPFKDAIENLKLASHNWGFQVPIRPSSLQKSFTKLLNKAKGSHLEYIVSIMILRSMKQAQYSSENIGHFGLAFDHYSHFTSPIRRYPDLVAHRVIKRILSGEKLSSKETSKLQEHMSTYGTFLSACEQRAVKTGRDLVSVKKCRFMETKVGESFEAMVTGIHKFGFFVQLRAYDIDGLVKLDTLKGGYQFHEESSTLVGQNSKTVISLGKLVTVKLMRSTPERREIDFEWTDEPDASTDDGKANRKDLQKRGKATSNRSGAGKARLSQRGRKGKTGTVRAKKDNKKRRTGKTKRRRKS